MLGTSFWRLGNFLPSNDHRKGRELFAAGVLVKDKACVCSQCWKKWLKISFPGGVYSQELRSNIHFTVNRGGDGPHKHSVFSVPGPGLHWASRQLVAPCHFSLPREWWRMPSLESRTLGETENYGIDLMEISSLHPEPDSSATPIIPEHWLR